MTNALEMLYVLEMLYAKVKQLRRLLWLSSGFIVFLLFIIGRMLWAR